MKGNHHTPVFSECFYGNVVLADQFKENICCMFHIFYPLALTATTLHTNIRGFSILYVITEKQTE